jgi:hypothetical protein
LVRPKCASSAADVSLDVVDELAVHRPPLLPLLVELVDLDIVCVSTGQFLVA